MPKGIVGSDNLPLFDRHSQCLVVHIGIMCIFLYFQGTTFLEAALCSNYVEYLIGIGSFVFAVVEQGKLSIVHHYFLVFISLVFMFCLFQLPILARIKRHCATAWSEIPLPFITRL